MRLDDLPTSNRIEDRRGLTGGRAGLGIGTVVILGLIGWALGIDPRVLIGDAERMSQNGHREVHARFWERLEVKFLRATRPSVTSLRRTIMSLLE